MTRSPRGSKPGRGRCGAVGTLLLLLTGATLAAAQEPPATEADLLSRYDERIRPLIVTYCLDCHDATAEGNLRLDTLERAFVPGTVAAWTRVRNVLDVGSMPPKGKRRPTPDESELLLQWIGQSLAHHDAKHRETGGDTPIRRINHRAYASMLRTLLGVPAQGMDAFPEDGTVHGFDTVGSALYTNTYVYELYLACAQRTLDLALTVGDRPPVRELRYPLTPLPGQRFTKHRSHLRQAIAELRRDPRAFAANGHTVISSVVDHMLVGLPANLEHLVERHLVADVVAARFGAPTLEEAAARDIPWADDPQCVGELIQRIERLIDGFEIMERHVSTWQPVNVWPFYQHHVGKLVPGWYTVSARMCLSNPKYPLPARLVAGDQTIHAFMLHEPPSAPRDVEVTVYWDPRWQTVEALSALPYGGDSTRPGFPTYYFSGHVKALHGELGDEQPGTRLGQMHWVDLPADPPRPEPAGILCSEITVRGPLTDAWPTAATARIFTRGLAAPPTRDYAHEIIAGFMQRAYVVAECPEEMTRSYVDLVMSHHAEHGDFVAAVKFGLAAILSSPRFLYLDEAKRADPAVRRPLDPFELARRLAYVLWSDLPDEALLASAADGSLRDRGVLLAQTRRMLRDARSRAFRSGFTAQWLRVDRIGRIAYSYDLFPAFDPLLLRSAAEESVAFFSEILDQNLSVSTFIDADFVMIDSRLAQHYGMSGIVGDAFRRVALRPGSHRGGVLTQASVLMATSNGMIGSTVRRGAFVMERLLGIAPGTPPPDVPALDEVVAERADGLPLTPSEKLAMHRANPSCARCHDRIDPLGTGLEPYDALGTWNAQVRVLLPQVSPTTGSRWVGRDADFRGAMPDGTSFTGPEGLKQRLREHPDRFLRCLAEHLAIYALGRELEGSDRPVLDRVCAEVAADGHTLASLVERLVLCELFTHK